MDSAPLPSTPVLDTLRTVEFRLGLKGYNVDEVDEFLEKAAVEAESLKEQVRQSVERLRQATERLAEKEREERSAPEAPPAAPVSEAPPSVSDDTLQRTLLLAQRFVEQTRRESEEEAAEIIGRAEEQAQVIVTQAEDRARQLTADSEHRLRAEVARLESTRSQLAADVESLARHFEAERARLRGSLNEMLKWLEEKVQPAASLLALRQRTGETARVDGPPAERSSTRSPSRAGAAREAGADRGSQMTRGEGGAEPPDGARPDRTELGPSAPGAGPG